jgi:phosphoglycolate phosphatase
MYKACIFDLDGTLLNTLFSIAEFSNEALKACHYMTIPPEDFRKIVGNGTVVQIERMLNHVKPEGHTKEEATHLRHIYESLYASDPCRKIANYPGIKELLKELNARCIPAAVLSNKPDPWVQKIIANCFPAQTFTVCCGQQDGIPRKPAPDGALKIAEVFHLAPQEILYIGDTNTDMQTGAAAGMDTAGALWGFRDAKELSQNHAVYLVKAPLDLLPIITQT